jgi:hypothetical protein
MKLILRDGYGAWFLRALPGDAFETGVAGVWVGSWIAIFAALIRLF